MSQVRCSNCGALNRVGAIARGAPRCGRCRAMLPWVVTAGAGSFEDEVEASVPVVVDLWAPWCGPCRLVEPVLEELVRRHAGALKIVKVNVDDEPALAARFHARSIPLLVVLDGGHEVDRIVGVHSRRALESRLSRFIG